MDRTRIQKMATASARVRDETRAAEAAQFKAATNAAVKQATARTAGTTSGIDHEIIIMYLAPKFIC
jgi:hypothetical protein